MKLVLRFAENVELPRNRDTTSDLPNLGDWDWQRFKIKYPDAKLDPRVNDSDMPAISNADSQQAMDALNRLARTFTLEVEAQGAERDVQNEIQNLQDVELLYEDTDTSFPQSVDPADDPYYSRQLYLQNPPYGIGANYAWNFPGGQGEGQHFVDVEHGWTLKHEDLVALKIHHIHGENARAGYRHGTSVLGEIFARDNDKGCVGICPADTVTVGVSSTRGSSVPAAIMAAINWLPEGSIVLLELQWINFSGYPNLILEAAEDVYDAILYGTSRGIVFIEAAGNGGHDLDQVEIGGKRIFDIASPDFRDSGAVVVGAGSSSLPAYRLYFSNHGSRINCFGWGHNVTTTSSDSNGRTDLYTYYFNGTSSASPIIAGAALIIQGVKEHLDGHRFSPNQIRQMLSDPDLGTSTGNPPTDKIGSLPNLQKILGSLGQYTDIYIRDNVSDNGNRHNRSSQSPDIILRNNRVSDPEAAFGKQSGRLNSPNLSHAVKRGRDNYLYGRAFFRSGSLARGNTIDFYWAKGSTLLVPKGWRHIGKKALPDFNQATAPLVSDGLVWPAAELPPAGHYCFIAVLQSDTDKVLDLSKVRRISDWHAFVKGNNNIAWRNFNVVNARRRASEPYPRTVEFIAQNTEDMAPMTLEVFSDLPPEPFGSLLMEAPQSFWDYVNEGRVTADTTPVRHPLSTQGKNEIVFDRAIPEQTTIKLIYDINADFNQRNYSVYARQLHRNIEVGRVHWDLRFHFDDDENPEDYEI